VRGAAVSVAVAASAAGVKGVGAGRVCIPGQLGPSTPLLLDCCLKTSILLEDNSMIYSCLPIRTRLLNLAIFYMIFKWYGSNITGEIAAAVVLRVYYVYYGAVTRHLLPMMST
jgi:hypothetical protein